MKTERERVLHIKHTLNPGGGCMIIYRFAQQLRDRYQFDWLTYCLTGNDWAYKFEKLGGTVQSYPDPGRLYHVENILLYCKYIHYIRSHHYSIVHLNTENPRNIRYLICAFLGGAKKRIMHSHNNGSIGVENNWKTRFNKWLIGVFATDYVACSQEAAEWLYPPNIVPKVIILKNGLDTKQFRFDEYKRNRIRTQYKLEDDQFVVGQIGRFVTQKNHMFILEAFSEVLIHDPKARLMLLGSGGLENRIRDKITELGIADKVIIVGQVDNVQDYMCAMDVLALPSLFEGLGMVNIEAQANGLHCVVSDRVARLAKVTDLLSFFPLEDGAEKWAEHLLAIKEKYIHREDYADIVRKAGWDIRDIAEGLTEIYRS